RTRCSRRPTSSGCAACGRTSTAARRARRCASWSAASARRGRTASCSTGSERRVTEPRIPWLPVVASAAIAFWTFAGTLDGGFLSDDVLMQVLGEARDEGFDVDWSAVFADFARPWLGFDNHFY